MKNAAGRHHRGGQREAIRPPRDREARPTIPAVEADTVEADRMYATVEGDEVGDRALRAGVDALVGEFPAYPVG